MLSGRRLDILDPSPFDIEIGDIALGLSRVARWNGQTLGEHAFSVADHSLLVVGLLDYVSPGIARKAKLAGLLHDASEYVTSDLITPFKANIGTSYKVIEKRVSEAVHIRFGLPPHLPERWTGAIKRADQVAAFLEATQLAGFEDKEARRVLGFRGRAPQRRIVALPPEEARLAFLKRFEGLESI